MNRLETFYEPAQMDYTSVVPAYQEAFKEEPWNEVSKCADSNVPLRCPGGLSALAISEWCSTCAARPDKQAYEAEELIERFKELAKTRPTLWYIEKVQGRVALAAVSWLGNTNRLASEKYTDVPAMQPWLQNKFGSGDFVYLDEIFRDKTVRPSGNLRNIQSIFNGFGEYFGESIVAYRSKQPRLLGKTKQVFGDQVDIAIANDTVPDWRDRNFVTINLDMQP